jgi:predicted negative regulator of RcsB-dependent stress response
MSKRKTLQTALNHLDKGDWDAAHKIVQSDDSAEGCWVHGIVHVMEGDLDNARYWYGRAKRAFSDDAVKEILAVKKTFS